MLFVGFAIQLPPVRERDRNRPIDGGPSSDTAARWWCLRRCIAVIHRRRSCFVLKKLKKGNMTYDDVISRMVDDESWDVEKLDADLGRIEKRSKFYSFEEVFKDV
ncbi:MULTISPECIES: hypothetical protein [unclassified Methanoculleus]|jgi:hypothetical protein|uniref:Uncharacterized protein n=1 Tax=Methanoculleus palmolei TaxID=72612 RepID=A0ABD8A887_9EURY|nr:hypothetical protein [Methanoculleus sp. UBA377]WOX55370.1 hypothetical protein R6Y95_07830 [Methanoculleus palmolei]